jgi:cysteine desulfurase
LVELEDQVEVPMATELTTPLIYLDYCATTPVDDRVLEVMLPFFSQVFGNAASQHGFGRSADEAVDEARHQVAHLLNCSPRDVIWTSGATESNNLALKGGARSLRNTRSHLITQATEHRAVLDPVSLLSEDGFDVTILEVDSVGQIESDAVREAIREDTALVSIMAANNETGTLLPILEIARVCDEAGVVFHTDASQLVGKISLDLEASGVDLLSFSGHKLYGPKGIGVLIYRKSQKLRKLHPLIHGGGHEHGMRSGTLNVPAIVGLGKACEIAGQELPSERSRIKSLRDQFESSVSERLPNVRINGDLTNRLPNVSNLAFIGIDAEGLMIALENVAASTGSACTASSLEPSHVLKAMRLSEERQLSSMRFSFGRQTTLAEIHQAIEEVVRTVRTLRALSSTSATRVLS